jgi:hypothetical protein
MKAKVINEGPERTIALILDRGDEVVRTLERFAADQQLHASRFTAIGAFERVTLGYFASVPAFRGCTSSRRNIRTTKPTGGFRTRCAAPRCCAAPASS